MPQPKNPLCDDLDHILGQTGTMWEELRGARLFITGGTGFFGCWLLESFLWANEAHNLGATVVVLSRDPEAFARKAPHLAQSPFVTLHAGDVRSFPFPEGEFSHIIHAATEASAKLNAEAPILMLDTIIEGTRRVLDFAVACGAKKFLLTSSGAVYGRQPSDITHTPEEYAGAPDPLDVGAAYGNGKRMAEHLCSLYAKRHGFEAKIARCYAFVGPHLPLDIHFAIGNFIRDALKGGPIRVKGDGSSYRSYLYAADLAVWLWTILFCGSSMRAYNVGSSKEISIAQLAEAVRETLHCALPIEIVGPQTSEGAPSYYVPSVELAAKELGLRERFTLQEAIWRTAQWGAKV